MNFYLIFLIFKFEKIKKLNLSKHPNYNEPRVIPTKGAIMKVQNQHTQRPVHAQRGITTIEYVLLAVGVAALIAGLVVFLGDGLQAAFINLCNTVGGAGTCV